MANEVIYDGTRVVTNLGTKKTASGTSINITDSAEGDMPLGIKGNTEQDSYTGKNKLPYENTTITTNGVTITHNEDDSITINGTTTESVTYRLFEGSKADIIEANKTYILSSKNDMPDKSILRLQDASSSSIFTDLKSETTGPKNYVRVTSSTYPTLNVQCFLYLYAGYTFNNVTIYPMLEENTEMTDYEPYVRTEFKVLLQNINKT